MADVRSTDVSVSSSFVILSRVQLCIFLCWRTNQDGGTAATICGPRTPSTYLYFGGVYAMGSCVRHGRAEICDQSAARLIACDIFAMCRDHEPYIVAVGGRFADFIRFFFSGGKIGNRQEIGNVAKSNRIGRRFQNRLQLYTVDTCS